MEDLKKYILTDQELDTLCARDDIQNDVIEDIATFVEHSKQVCQDNTEGYRKMIEYEGDISDYTFSFAFQPYYLEDFDLALDEFVGLALGCFVDFELEYACFYEEDSDYCLAEYGLDAPEYIKAQMTEFLDRFGIFIDDLKWDFSSLYEGVSYTIHILTVTKEYLPFEEVADLFQLQKTNVPGVYLHLSEDWNDGYYHEEDTFQLREIREVLEKETFSMLKENKRTAAEVRKLHLAINNSNVVHTIYSIFDTKEEVMF